MLFSIVLLTAYAALWPFTHRRWNEQSRWRGALAAAMVVAGLAHFVTPVPFVQHLPDWVPERFAIIYASGVVEVVFGLGLLVGRGWQSLIGVALAAYLVAVFPANVYVAVAGVDVEGQPGGIYPWIRLPFQALFVWLALWSTGVFDAWASLSRASADKPLGSRLVYFAQGLLRGAGRIESHDEADRTLPHGPLRQLGQSG